jgi:anti-anti-sigma regulatory factor
MNRLSLRVREGNGRALLEAEGAVDAETYAEFQARLLGLMRRSDVLLDLSRVQCLSASGLGAIVAAT